MRLCSRTNPNRRSGAVRRRDHAHPARRGLHPEAPAFEVARHRPAARRRLPGLLLRVLPGPADRWRHLARPGRRERRDVRAWARRGAIRARQRRDIGPGRYRDVRATRRGRILRAWSGRLRRLRWRRGLLPDSNVPSAGGAHGIAPGSSYLGSTRGLPPGVPGGGITGVVPGFRFGAGARMPGSTPAGGRISPPNGAPEPGRLPRSPSDDGMSAPRRSAGTCPDGGGPGGSCRGADAGCADTAQSPRTLPVSRPARAAPRTTPRQPLFGSGVIEGYAVVA